MSGGGKLRWTFGAVRIRVGMVYDVPGLQPKTSSDLRHGRWEERRGWSSGLFTIHVDQTFEGPRATLSHKRTGCAIHASSSALYLFEFAERIAHLDWSGRIEEFVPRNADAFSQASREAKKAEKSP